MILFCRGWVNESSICAFTPENALSSARFSEKSFKKDKDYQAAVIEAFRLARGKGATFPQSVLDTISKTTEVPFEESLRYFNFTAFCRLIDLQQDVIWQRSDVCTKCKGTEYSGPSLICDKCNMAETHFHCLVRPVLHPPLGAWYCDKCCKVMHFLKLSILPHSLRCFTFSTFMLYKNKSFL